MDEERKELSTEADVLIRELSARIKIKDIKELYRLKDQIEVKWWEEGVLLALFFAGLGFVATLLFFLPEKNVQLYYKFLIFWGVFLILVLVASVEMVIKKLRALYRLYILNFKVIEELQRRLQALRQQEHDYDAKSDTTESGSAGG